MGAARRRAGRGLGLPRSCRSRSAASGVGGRPLRVRPAAEPGHARAAARLPAPHRRQRLAGLRDAASTSSGNPYRGPCPNRLSARITPRRRRRARRPRHRRARRASRWSCSRHDPGGAWRALPTPPRRRAAAGRRRSARPRRSPASRGRARSPSRPSTRAASTGLFFAPHGPLGRRRAIAPLRRRRAGRASRSRSPAGSEAELPRSSRSTRPGSATPGRWPKPTTGARPLGRPAASAPSTPAARSGSSGRWRGTPFAAARHAGAGDRRRRAARRRARSR